MANDMRDTAPAIASRLLAALLAAVLLGCSPQAKQEYNDAAQKQAVATQATEKALKTDVQNTTAAASQKANEAGVTLKVKTALVGAVGVDTRNIDVDTTGSTVTLKGSVPSAEQKTRAEQIAKGELGNGWTVDDQLTVAGK